MAFSLSLCGSTYKLSDMSLRTFSRDGLTFDEGMSVQPFIAHQHYPFPTSYSIPSVSPTAFSTWRTQSIHSQDIFKYFYCKNNHGDYLLIFLKQYKVAITHSFSFLLSFKIDDIAKKNICTIIIKQLLTMCFHLLVELSSNKIEAAYPT